MFYRIFRDAPDVRPLNVLGGAYSAFCNAPPPPSLDLPRERGQCTVKYRVNASGTVKTGNNPSQQWTGAQVGCTNIPDVLYGPITGPFLHRPGSGGQWVVSFTGKNGQGQVVTYNVFSAPYNNGQTQVTIGSSTIERCDGQPDECGNFIPPPNPPGTTVYNDNRQYIDNNNVTHNIDLNFTAPSVYINADGHLNVRGEVTVDFDVDATVNIPVTVDVSTGDISFNIGTGLGDNRDGTDDTDYDYDDGNNPAPNPDPDIEEPPTDDTDDSGDPSRRVIRGVFVVASEVDTHTVGQIAQSNTPTILIPCLGYVSFLIGVGLRKAWTTEIPVKSVNAFIPCPWEGGALDVRFSPRGDTVATLTPVFYRQQPSVD